MQIANCPAGSRRGGIPELLQFAICIFQFSICKVRLFVQGVQLKMRAALPGPSISIVSEPRAVATGSYAQLSINSYFVSYFFDLVATARGSDTIRGDSHI